MVTEETRKLVAEMAQKMRYRASITARSLRLQRSWSIGLIASDIADSFYAEILSAIEAEAWEHGFSVLMGNTEYDDAKQSRYIESMLDKRVDGLILSSHRLLDEDIVAINRQNTPVVFVNRFDSRLDADFVGVDNIAGTRMVMQHLIGLGHRRIGFIAGRAMLRAAHQRHTTYLESLETAGIAVDQAVIGAGDYTSASGRAAAEKLFDLPDPPTAIFAANDKMALGVMAAAVDRGLSVPKDISVAGFDDIDIAAHPLISLTTVRTPFRELGRIAATLILDRIDHKDRASQEVVLPPRFVVRNSVAPPRQRQ
jgi:DNA-binding LacI/PurR family transcriptional regulator